MEIYRELNGRYGLISKENVIRASEYIVLTGDNFTDYASIFALENLRLGVLDNIQNDKLKYCLPESLKVSLTLSINIRSLMNMLSLRTDKSALWEFRDLANNIFNILPKEYQFLLKDYMKEV